MSGNSVDLEADRKEQAISVQATDSNIEFGTEKAQEVDIVKGIDSDSNREVVAEEGDNEFGDFVSEMRSSLNDVDKSTRQEQDDNLKRWQQRQEFVISCIISHHLNQKDFILVLKWFKQLLLNHPSDPSLYSKLGYVLMQLGDLNGASRVFEEVERIVGETKNDPSSSYLKCLIYRNRGMKLVSQKKYLEAIKEFEAALAIDPLDVVSANNKALCSMYSRDLIGSTKVLESILDKAPSLALNESLVLNLCSMYELASVHNHQTKKNLSDWIQKVAPSDFDISCTRL
jgi:tetratricopeptide (TPR) repeat protein